MEKIFTKDTVESMRKIIDGLDKENTQLKDLVEKLKQEAQVHAMEAKTQKGIVPGIYQALGIQQGDWNGKKPVVEIVEQLKARNARLEDFVSELNKSLRGNAVINYGLDYKLMLAESNKLLNEKPQQSLVEHDCEVIEKLKRYLCELAENATENGYKDEANFMSETVEQVDIYISDNLRNSVKDGEL